MDEYGDYGGRVQDYDDDGNPTDSDLEDSLDDTEQADDPESLGDLLDEATRAEHDGKVKTTKRFQMMTLQIQNQNHPLQKYLQHNLALAGGATRSICCNKSISTERRAQRGIITQSNKSSWSGQS